LQALLAPGAPPPPLRDVDSFERVQLLRIVVWFGPPCFIMLSFLWFFLRRQGVIPAWLFVVLLALNIPLTAAGVFLIHGGTSLASQGLVKTIEYFRTKI